MLHRQIGALLNPMTPFVVGEWTPPTRPAPLGILNEAQADARAGRYSDALAKHLWFHRNALAYERSLYGVRLSFALAYWLELAKQYPPALRALEHIREETVARLRAGTGTRDDFDDVASINEFMNEEAATTELFVWLDKNRTRFARKVYDIAERALIKSRNYSLCGKYIDSSRATRRTLQLYREHQRMAKDPRFGGRLQGFSQRSFSRGAATLVALLAHNGRGAEADQVTDAVLKEWPDEGFRKKLGRARKGVVPKLRSTPCN